MTAAAPPRRPLNSRWRNVLFFLFVFAFGRLFDAARAQNTNSNNTATTTDPLEARALDTIFGRWGISATDGWNISGELCSGVATNGTDIGSANINPGITCDCSSANGSLCHITALRVLQLRLSLTLPDELWNLTYLTYLDLGQIGLTGPISASIGNLRRLQYLNLGMNELSGELPRELGFLTEIRSLDLHRNYLTGPLPASIGNLNRMQYLNIGANALSGELPKELGLLSALTSLGFGTNNFSGPLPAEIGNLTRLNALYCDSAGLSGPIPSTFARLRNMSIVWAFDNDFTGRIPDFFGNWTGLTQLILQGNSFQGPIPQSFSNLASLNDLRISELPNGTSSLYFLRNMTFLSILILRNNNISGSVPSFLGQFQHLSFLDLSFNNLMGQIPAELFNSSSLKNLFLGNNRLTGGLPSQKSPTLRNIDLSYNELSGNFPSWLGGENLQVNLVANNFIIGNSSSSVLPPGLNCLQRNFPCNRDLPIYSSFAIKCGGPQMRSFDQTLYEKENDPLGPATHFVTDTNRWAVSNAGLALDSTSPQYQTSSSSPFANTVDDRLFQTARISAGSLRYYGLGLVNGNYTVKLQFAESVIPDGKIWQSLGKRVFDVYIQGNLELKNFDIQKEAGGASFRAVMRNFTVQVLENYLEIHLFWAGKGTCCVPITPTYGPIISAISATSDLEPRASIDPMPTGLIAGIVIVVTATLLCLAAVFFVLKRRKRRTNFEDEELLGMVTQLNTFSYMELKAATDDFSPANKLGEGGFGPVYKGTLGDERVVAVKQLSRASNQGKTQFKAEIATISAVQHRNLVKLYGCCIEGDKRLLVYEYLENKSLDKVLFGTGNNSLFLDWATRFDVCLGVARGLAYLHEESRPRIVHRDVKASNILLDSNLTAKISDFGLAKLYDDKMTHISTRVAGTIGYLAPEYAMRGRLTEKADIFSFGVVALEIISGRPNSDSTLKDGRIYLLEWAWNLHENEKELELVDPTLHEYNPDEVNRIIHAALLCIQASPALRPSMSRVVGMLSGDIQVPCVTTRPGYLTGWDFNDVTTFETITDSSTSNADISHVNQTSATMTPDPTAPMLHEIIEEGR